MTASEVENAEKQCLFDYFKLLAKLSTSNVICFRIKKYESRGAILEELFSFGMHTIK